jgi:MoxR-like ATPase
MDHSAEYNLHQIYCLQMLWGHDLQHKAKNFYKKRTNFANFVLADEINRAPAKVQFGSG